MEAGISKGVEDLLTALRNDKSDTAKKVRKLISKIQKLDLDQGANPAQYLRYLDEIQSLLPHYEQIQMWLSSCRQKFDRWATFVRQQFGAELADELQSLDITLQGQVPNLRAGIFTIKLFVEQNKAEIWYGPEQEHLSDCAIHVTKVCKEIKHFKENLGCGLDPQTFVQKLVEALRRISPTEQQHRIPLVRVLPEVAFLIQQPKFYSNPIHKHYRGYSRADFSYDLFRCAEEDMFHTQFQLVVATRMHTARKNGYLWVPTDHTGRGSTYSHIIFKEA